MRAGGAAGRLDRAAALGEGVVVAVGGAGGRAPLGYLLGRCRLAFGLRGIASFVCGGHGLKERLSNK